MGTAHPVSVYLANALQLNVGTILAGIRILIPPKYGSVDTIFSINSTGAVATIAERYLHWSLFDQDPDNNYKTRGIPITTPVYKHSITLYSQLLNTTIQLINIYYADDATVAADTELQNWAKDAAENGKVAGLPYPITTRSNLALVLPFTNDQPIPSKRGTVNAQNIMDWLPNPIQAINQASLTADFTRPLADADSLYWAFNNTDLNTARTACVWADYRAGMDTISTAVQDSAAADSIFKWTSMDPHNLPNYVYV
ncbi:hypothetical protein HDU76_011524 [Blyttiomyces sp. JEL0837]|nr:hypothetical protein HDU76_011524 [Blyttiomyces sp. JEL0837]